MIGVDKGGTGMGTIDYGKLGRRIRELRKAHGLTQQQVADRIDCVESFVSHIENGKTKPSLETLLRLGQLFQVSLDSFFLDSPSLLPSTVINGKIAPKLEKCDALTLQTVADMLDILVAEQEARKGQD